MVFFPINNVFFTYDVIGEADEIKNGELDVFFHVYFACSCLMMHLQSLLR